MYIDAICINSVQIDLRLWQGSRLMGDFLRQGQAVADRVTVDIEGLREAIEVAYSGNPLWAELSLSQKLRWLIQERLDELKSSNTDEKK
jgi:hypothetical protein